MMEVIDHFISTVTWCIDDDIFVDQRQLPQFNSITEFTT
jgi:hypothetical protein